jgi:hypothetical protein
MKPSKLNEFEVNYFDDLKARNEELKAIERKKVIELQIPQKIEFFWTNRKFIAKSIKLNRNDYPNTPNNTFKKLFDNFFSKPKLDHDSSRSINGIHPEKLSIAHFRILSYEGLSGLDYELNFKFHKLLTFKTSNNEKESFEIEYVDTKDIEFWVNYFNELYNKVRNTLDSEFNKENAKIEQGIDRISYFNSKG